MLEMLTRWFLGDRVLSGTRPGQSPNPNPGLQLLHLVLIQAVRDEALCVHFSPCPRDGELKISYFIPHEADSNVNEQEARLADDLNRPKQSSCELPAIETATSPSFEHPKARWIEMRPVPADLCEPIANELRLLAGISMSQQTGSVWISVAGQLRRLHTIACRHEVFVFTSVR
ncbi:MAG: hypothetical protein H6819_05385 [Phycisphaerales bacterium]|nr:hypothetical protein [Phycisphaerales bacterium]MCB9854788.1 hypothetical protein [Phycisphaerales bacterium]MCB9863740.1 hypothetical protein [Phycisphaerales bacterium]